MREQLKAWSLLVAALSVLLVPPLLLFSSPSFLHDYVTRDFHKTMQQARGLDELKDVTISTLEKQQVPVPQLCDGRRGLVLTLMRRFG